MSPTSIGFLGLFVFLASGLALAWLVLLLWRLLGNRRRASAQPACARCLYPTTTLATPRCPECGADLIREGVITPTMRVRQGGGAILAAGAWTILVGIGSLVLASWASVAMPIPMELRVSVRAAPASGAYQEVAVRGVAGTTERFFLGGFGADGPADLTLTVRTNDGASVERTFVRRGDERFFRLDDGRIVDDFSSRDVGTLDVVRELLAQAGADNPSIDQEAAEIANMLTSGMPWWSFGGGGVFTSVSNATHIMPANELLGLLAAATPFGVLLLGAVAWLVGVILLFNQHAKRFRPRRPANQPTPDSTQTPPVSAPGAAM